ncbi:MAG: glycosyltransferase family 4 protein [Candidatus Nanohaloarchaea archaeon]
MSGSGEEPENKTVYLSNPGHELFKRTIRNPPEGVEYCSRSFSGLRSIYWKQAFSFLEKKLTTNLNTHLVASTEEIDLIHSNGSILLEEKRDWMVDFEEPCAFTFFNLPDEREKEIIVESLESENCRRLLPHCVSAYKGLKNLYDISDKVVEKMDVVYPSTRIPDEYQKDNGKISLMFVARKFEIKGGYEAVEVFEELQESVEKEIELILVTNLPEDVGELPENTRVYSGVERSKLEELYREADLFLYPTYNDSFGVVMIEAMAFGLPVIALDEYATDEIVSDDESGYIVEGYSRKWFEKDTKVRRIDFPDNPQVENPRVEEEGERDRIVDTLFRKTKKLVEEDNRRKAMAEKSREIARKKFSNSNRRQRLGKIYWGEEVESYT